MLEDRLEPAPPQQAAIGGEVDLPDADRARMRDHVRHAGMEQRLAITGETHELDRIARRFLDGADENVPVEVARLEILRLGDRALWAERAAGVADVVHVIHDVTRKFLRSLGLEPEMHEAPPVYISVAQCREVHQPRRLLAPPSIPGRVAG